MRILLACPYAWDVAGGVQTHVRELARGLAARDHEVAVVAPARAPHARAASRPFQLPTVDLVGRVVGFPWAGSTVTACFSHRSLRRIRAVVREFRPDVVHAHEPFAPSTAMLATIVATAPVIATFHAFSETSRVLQGFAPLLRRIVCRRIAASIAVSETAAELAGRVMPGPIAIVPNGVPVDHFRRPSGRALGAPEGRVILWVHRLDPRKGFTVALRAFAVLAGELDDVQLLVIGDGPEREALTLVPARHRRRITMLGQIDNADLPPFYASADVFLACSRGPEAFGISIVEAMAAGVPVVASDLTAHREVVRHGNGAVLVPPGDPAALATALRRVLTDPALAADLGRAGRAHAPRYDWDVVVPALEAIYLRVATATSRPRRQRGVSVRRRNAIHAMPSKTTSRIASSP